VGKTRLEAFSDGVLAIIVTIMVLEMHAPHGTDWASVKPLVPKFLSYGLSFLFVAIYWVNHHHLLHTVKRVTSSIMWANINLLFWLSLIPFATAWMGDNHFAGTTVAAYALLALLCGAAFNILQAAIVSAHRSQALVKDIVKPTGWKSMGSLILYLAAIPIALFINPVISGWIFLLVGLIWLVPDKKIEQAFKE
jgi:uncharacterized membrane protein